jgi:hypothetical protein
MASRICPILVVSSTSSLNVRILDELFNSPNSSASAPNSIRGAHRQRAGTSCRVFLSRLQRRPTNNYAARQRTRHGRAECTLGAGQPNGRAPLSLEGAFAARARRRARALQELRLEARLFEKSPIFQGTMKSRRIGCRVCVPLSFRNRQRCPYMLG